MSEKIIHLIFQTDEEKKKPLFGNMCVSIVRLLIKDNLFMVGTTRLPDLFECTTIKHSVHQAYEG